MTTATDTIRYLWENYDRTILDLIDGTDDLPFTAHLTAALPLIKDETTTIFIQYDYSDAHLDDDTIPCWVTVAHTLYSVVRSLGRIQPNALLGTGIKTLAKEAYDYANDYPDSHVHHLSKALWESDGWIVPAIMALEHPNEHIDESNRQTVLKNIYLCYNEHIDAVAYDLFVEAATAQLY